MNSYGSTEIGGIARDGKLLPIVQARLVDWEGYKVTDRPYPRGELLVKTFSAHSDQYYKAEESTKDSFTEDGYFKTGSEHFLVF